MATHYTYGVTHSLFSFGFSRRGLWRIFCRLGSHALLRCRRFLRRELDCHSLSFQNRHLVYLRIIFQVIGKTEQQHFSLLFEQDRTTFKEYVGFHLIAIFQKAFGMLQLEIIVMVISLRSKTYFLHVYLHLLCLLLFLTLL